MIGSEIDEAETIFIPCRRILLLTLSKRLVSTSAAKHQHLFVPFQHLLGAGGDLPHRVLHILTDIAKTLETTRIATDTIGASTIRISDSCQL